MKAKWFRNGTGKWHLRDGKRSACRQQAFGDGQTSKKTRRADRCKACRRKDELPW